MVIAIVIFLSSSGPVYVTAGRQIFNNDESCQNFIAANTEFFNSRRLQLQIAFQQPVSYTTICYDMGRGA
jgi:hypothetical protein